jgi:DNA processing protein
LSVVTVEEPGYPSRLAAIEMPPHVLFVRGDPRALLTERAVAVVGTRRATTMGRTIAGRISIELAASGAAVVSGLAFGIDGAAHEATLRAGGTTVAVIGGGHAVLSPQAHSRLAAAIVAGGGAVVSELAPDVEPTHGTFPRRNRIISGLAEATVVVEAPARSGALITASWALEQGRECFLVPGPLDAPASAGCLAFLREFEHSAHLVAGIPQLIADLGLVPTAVGGPRDAVAAATLQAMGQTEAVVAGHVVRGHVTVDEIVAAARLPVATVLAALAILERRGLVVGVHGRFRPAGTLLGAPRTPRPR